MNQTLNARIPCRLQPSAPYCSKRRPVVTAAAVPTSNNDSSKAEDAWFGDSSAGSTVAGQQQQQKQQQQKQQQPGSWGSSWVGRTNSRTQKPESLFKMAAGERDRGSSRSRSNSTAPPEAAPVDPALEASIRQNVDRAAQALQEIVNEVLNGLLIEEASAYVLDEQAPSLQLNQAVRNAVVKRLEWLDANFLAALNAYLAAPSVAANDELRTLLLAVRDEVLDLVSARLPPSVQVLNVALASSSRSERCKVVKSALAGGAGSLPGATLEALGAAATQLVEDMEDQQVIADRVLLARLVLLREELRLLGQQQDAAQQFFSNTNRTESGAVEPGSSSHIGDSGTGSGNSSPNKLFAFHRSNLPARCAAFVKALLAVPEQDRRLGLITKAFQEDWVGESPTSLHQTQQTSRPLRDDNFSQQHRPESLDIVRPGRFFSTLLAMQAELEQQLVGLGLSGSSSEQTLAVLRQLEAIRVEALLALDRIQRSRVVGSQESSMDAMDYELAVP